jgi:hypothetical protein
MRKIVLKVCSIAFCGAILFVNVNLDKDASSNDVSLKGLLFLSANIYAENCPEGPLPSGKCNTFSGRCYGNPGGPWDCDITVWNPW